MQGCRQLRMPSSCALPAKHLMYWLGHLFQDLKDMDKDSPSCPGICRLKLSSGLGRIGRVPFLHWPSRGKPHAVACGVEHVKCRGSAAKEWHPKGTAASTEHPNADHLELLPKLSLPEHMDAAIFWPSQPASNGRTADHCHFFLALSLQMAAARYALTLDLPQGFSN